MIQLQIHCAQSVRHLPNWHPIATAPFNLDLQLAVIEADGVHALVFPCRRGLEGWTRSQTGQRIDIWPTHWREWHEDADFASVDLS